MPQIGWTQDFVSTTWRPRFKCELSSEVVLDMFWKVHCMILPLQKCIIQTMALVYQLKWSVCVLNLLTLNVHSDLVALVLLFNNLKCLKFLKTFHFSCLMFLKGPLWLRRLVASAFTMICWYCTETHCT